MKEYMDSIQQIRFREEIAKANYEVELKKIKLYEISKKIYIDTEYPFNKWQMSKDPLKVKIIEAEINILLLDIQYLQTKLSE